MPMRVPGRKRAVDSAHEPSDTRSTRRRRGESADGPRAARERRRGRGGPGTVQIGGGAAGWRRSAGHTTGSAMSGIARTSATGQGGMLPELLAWSSSLRDDRALVREDLVGSAAHVTMLARTGIVSVADARVLRDALRALYDEACAGSLQLCPATRKTCTWRSRRSSASASAPWRRASTPPGRATTRSRSTSGCTCATRACALRRRARRARGGAGRSGGAREGRAAPRVHAPPARAARQRGVPRRGVGRGAGARRRRDRLRARPDRDAARQRRLLGDVAAHRPRARGAAVRALGADAQRAPHGRRPRLRARLDVGRRARGPRAGAHRDRRGRLLDERVRPRAPRRRDRRGLEHDAAEEEPRRLRARARQERAGGRQRRRAADADEGARQRLQPRPAGRPAAAARGRPAGARVRAGRVARARRTSSSTAQRGRRALDEGFTQATDLAEALVRRGIPFREAYKAVGRLVALAVRRGDPAARRSTPARAKAIHAALDAEALRALEPAAAVAAKESLGGTGPRAVDAQIAWLRERAPDARAAGARPTVRSACSRERVFAEPLELA